MPLHSRQPVHERPLPEPLAVQRDATYDKRASLLHADAQEMRAAIAACAAGTARAIVGANFAKEGGAAAAAC